MRPALVRYHNVVMDNARWEGFPFRDGDIIIATPAKCGTTWTQMICALLIFQTPEFPRPLDEISPWLDMLTADLATVVSSLEQQTHRRFIKSHTPLDGLPRDERVTYICIGRDPRDVAISMDNHMENLDLVALFEQRAEAVGLDDLAELLPDGIPMRADNARDRIWQWIDGEGTASGMGLAETLHHITTFFAARSEPNVVLLHYDDLKADLEGQMRALAARLGIDIAEDRWLQLVSAAGFEPMRRRAKDVAPNATRSIWHSLEKFFNSGTSGQWRRVLDADDLKRYAARVAELCDSEVSDWLHKGSIT